MKDIRECRMCDEDYEYNDAYPHTEGFCSIICIENWKRNYDNYVDPYNAYH